jgi:hypothetical protein
MQTYIIDMIDQAPSHFHNSFSRPDLLYRNTLIGGHRRLYRLHRHHYRGIAIFIGYIVTVIEAAMNCIGFSNTVTEAEQKSYWLHRYAY